MFSDLAPSARHSARPRVGGNGERKRKREMEGPTTDNFAVAFFTGEIATNTLILRFVLSFTCTCLLHEKVTVGNRPSKTQRVQLQLNFGSLKAYPNQLQTNQERVRYLCFSVCIVTHCFQVRSFNRIPKTAELQTGAGACWWLVVWWRRRN